MNDLKGPGPHLLKGSVSNSPLSPPAQENGLDLAVDLVSRLRRVRDRLHGINSVLGMASEIQASADASAPVPTLLNQSLEAHWILNAVEEELSCAEQTAGVFGRCETERNSVAGCGQAMAQAPAPEAGSSRLAERPTQQEKAPPFELRWHLDGEPLSHVVHVDQGAGEVTLLALEPGFLGTPVLSPLGEVSFVKRQGRLELLPYTLRPADREIAAHLGTAFRVGVAPTR